MPNPARPVPAPSDCHRLFRALREARAHLLRSTSTSTWFSLSPWMAVEGRVEVRPRPCSWSPTCSLLRFSGHNLPPLPGTHLPTHGVAEMHPKGRREHERTGWLLMAKPGQCSGFQGGTRGLGVQDKVPWRLGAKVWVHAQSSCSFRSCNGSSQGPSEKMARSSEPVRENQPSWARCRLRPAL